jgi:tetratricopeptide (TPR) repeat protein
VQAAPDDSFTHAVRAFVLDWYAYNPLVSKEETQDRLIEANNEAVRAFQIDPNNALALAYYAEILADQQKWVQAEQYAMQAVALDPNSMDTHRVLGYVEETMGNWNTAIQQYKRASELAPNMTFLLISIGQNYRDSRIHNFDLALEYFDRAAKINAALGVQNPIPYIEIAKTYTQQGEFFAAGINAKKALSLDRTNAHTYGQLGIIFMRARNYEGAMPLLKCAVRGCTVEESGEGWKADGIAITNLQSSGTGTSGSTWNVEPLPITSLSIGYYYFEYGNVLAFLSRPTAGANYCADARLALQEAEQAYPNDVVLMENIIEAENICNRLESRPMRPSRQPTATPEPVAEP